MVEVLSRTRELTCARCRRRFDHPVSRGRYPQRCPTCRTMVSRENDANDKVRLRRHVAAARRLLPLVLEQIRLDDDGKAAVGRAVRRLAYAEGGKQTREAALAVAAAALGWAVTISGEDERPIDELLRDVVV
jgi:hypothetical protein